MICIAARRFRFLQIARLLPYCPKKPLARRVEVPLHAIDHFLRQIHSYFLRLRPVRCLPYLPVGKYGRLAALCSRPGGLRAYARHGRGYVLGLAALRAYAALGALCSPCLACLRQADGRSGHTRAFLLSGASRSNLGDLRKPPAFAYSGADCIYILLTEKKMRLPFDGASAAAKRKYNAHAAKRSRQSFFYAAGIDAIFANRFALHIADVWENDYIMRPHERSVPYFGCRRRFSRRRMRDFAAQQSFSPALLQLFGSFFCLNPSVLLQKNIFAADAQNTEKKRGVCSPPPART